MYISVLVPILLTSSRMIFEAGSLFAELHIPVIPAIEIYQQPDYLIILAWNFAKSIMDNHEKFREDGQVHPTTAVEIF